VKKTIFVATYPNKAGQPPAYMDEFAKHFNVLHPSYNFDSAEGQKMVESIGSGLPPADTNVWRQIYLRDAWAIKKSNILIYDNDVYPGNHFLSLAIENQIPVIGMSTTLKEANSYFSGFILSVAKPDTIIPLLNLYLKETNASETLPTEVATQ